MKNEDTRAQLEHLPVGKLLLNYALPSIVSMVVVALYNIIDRVFIGQGVGSMAISGLALTFPLMSLIAAIGTLVGVGASARISIVLGMKDVNWARKILGNAFILTFILSTILIVISLLYLDDILILFGGSPQTIPYAIDYLKIVIPASLFTNICFSFCNMMRASGYPMKSMYIILVGVILNTILDPILIFGFDMGIEGAAIATAISMFVSALLAVMHFMKKSSYIRFHAHCFKLEGYIIRNILSIGLAPFLVNATACTVNIILNNSLVSYGGDLAIGAYGIINSYAFFVVMVIMGLCQGMQPIVGYNFGARKMKRVKDTLRITIRASIVITTVSFLVAEIFSRLLIRAFSSDSELIDLTMNGLRIVFLAFPVIGFQIVVSQFFLSISKPSKAIFMTLSRQVIFLIPCLYVFGTIWGLHGVWFAMPFSDFVATIVAFFFLRHEQRVFYGQRRIRFRR